MNSPHQCCSSSETRQEMRNSCANSRTISFSLHHNSSSSPHLYRSQLSATRYRNNISDVSRNQLFRVVLAVSSVNARNEYHKPSSLSNRNKKQEESFPARDLLALEANFQPGYRETPSGKHKLRSWIGSNGQYVRELPCPSCRGRGYTSCTACGVDRSRLSCTQCNGKGVKTCWQCSGDRVIWEEFFDEIPWEKAHSSSPFKVKEDDEVDKLDITLVSRKKRIYNPLSPEVVEKIRRSLKDLNAKTGIFSKRMRDLHRDPILRAKRIAAIKMARGTKAARNQTSESLKTFFSNPENRIKRSIAMKGSKFFCSYCGREGHRMHYCLERDEDPNHRQRRKCRMCGERGHNSRTCGQSLPTKLKKKGLKEEVCKICGMLGYDEKRCPQLHENKREFPTLISKFCRTYSCRLCLEKGHNSRTCKNNKPIM